MARRSFVSEAVINAPVGVVWSVLSDVESWPSWTPTMTSVVRKSGSGFSVGSLYEVKQPGLTKAAFTVESIDDGEAFSWTSTAIGVTTRADHVLTSVSDRMTRVQLVLEMEGAIAPLVWLLAGRKVRSFVELEAASLKSAAESR